MSRVPHRHPHHLGAGRLGGAEQPLVGGGAHHHPVAGAGGGGAGEEHGLDGAVGDHHLLRPARPAGPGHRGAQPLAAAAVAVVEGEAEVLVDRTRAGQPQHVGDAEAGGPAAGEVERRRRAVAGEPPLQPDRAGAPQPHRAATSTRLSDFMFVSP